MRSLSAIAFQMSRDLVSTGGSWTCLPLETSTSSATYPVSASSGSCGAQQRRLTRNDFPAPPLIDGRKATYNGITGKGAVRKRQHLREDAKAQPKLRSHAAGHQATEVVSIAAVPLPDADTVVKDLVEVYGPEIVSGVTAKVAKRDFMVTLEGFMAAFGRTYRGSASYNVVLNEFLRTPDADHVGLNGNNALPGSG